MKKTRALLMFAVLAGACAATAFTVQVAQAEAGVGSSQSNADCSACHGNSGLKMILTSGEELPLYVDRSVYSKSVHGGLDCQACHAEYALPHSPVSYETVEGYRAAAMEICRNCHPGERIALKSSVHANLDFKTITCMDCHGTHDIEHAKAANLRSTTLELCISCHQNEALMKQYGLSSSVVTTYLKDFHGRTSILLSKGDSASIDAAVCMDCHGIHKILDVESPDSQVVRANLASTCQKCHEDATPNFPDGWMSHYEPSVQKTPLVFAARAFYWMMIPFTLVGLVFHISIDVRHLIRRRREAKR